ncbi:FtsK/SpoIIIE domain-containing protein [Streptomyces sp. x-45]|uniref:FtsK/SpoIIIE domain-containing protein n=1 Tax=Streptomyces sp. x-45 TaxID=2789281 RepID=UPI00397EAAF4
MPAARKRRRPAARRPAAGPGWPVGAHTRTWLAFTLGRDRSRAFGKVPHVLLNWLILPLLAGAWYLQWRQWQVLSAVTVTALLYTIGRAARVIPRQRRALSELYGRVMKPCGLPAPTVTRPVNEGQYIRVTRWRRSTVIAAARIMIAPSAPAAQARTRWQAEKAVEAAPIPPGTGWVFDWANPGSLACDLVNEGDPRLLRMQDERWINTVVGQLFPAPRGVDVDVSVAVGAWEDRDGREVPTELTVTLGAYDVSQRAFRENVERVIDAQIDRGHVWIYTWQPGELTIRGVPAGSPEAIRKQGTRYISDLITAQIPARQAGQLTVDITKWEDDPNSPRVNTPLEITIGLGTLDVAAPELRTRIERTLDTALSKTLPDRTWLPDWTFANTNRLVLKAVSNADPRAVRKRETARLQAVVESKFPTKRGQDPVEVDIHTWSSHRGSNGSPVERPESFTVTFGAYDVTKPETRDAFEQHADSLTDTNDWHYAWSEAEGRVTVSAVPRLPTQLAFPEPGSPEFKEFLDLARRGTIRFGPVKGGGWLDWDLQQTPHALIGGKTGAGKSVALSLILFPALYDPTIYQLIVCDPKRTDFTWTPEFPAVIRFAATDEEIYEAIQAFAGEMDKRQSLLNKYGRRNLQLLRDAVARGEVVLRDDDTIPGRLILFFDEIADYLAKSANKEIEELKNDAKAMLEKVARLGRALETNIACAAQKPAGDILGMQLRSQLGRRLGVGPLDQYESQQILNSDHGTRFPAEGTPKGRSWGYDPKYGYQQAQIMYLPDDTTPLPWDPTVTIYGAKDLARAHLAELGYVQVLVPNKDGGQDPRWVRGDLVDEPPPTPDSTPAPSPRPADEPQQPRLSKTPAPMPPPATSSAPSAEPEQPRLPEAPAPTPSPAAPAPQQPASDQPPEGNWMSGFDFS